MVCAPDVKTGNSPSVFKPFVANFKAYTDNPLWKESYAPYCKDGGVECSEYEDVPDEVGCDVTPPTNVQRVCHCVNKGKCVSLTRMKSLFISGVLFFYEHATGEALLPR